MKEELTNKELEIKNAVEGLSFDINTDDLWANIEPQLPPKNGNKSIPFWWRTAGVIAGISFVLILSILCFIPSNHIPNKPIASKIQDSYTITPNDVTPNHNSQNNTSTKSKINSQPVKTNVNLNSTTPQTHYNDGQNHDLMDIGKNYNSGNLISSLANVHQPISTKSTLTNPIHNTSNPIHTKPTKLTSDQNRELINGVSTIHQLKLQLLENSKSENLNLPNLIEPTASQSWYSYWQVSTGINKSLSKTTLQNNSEIEKGNYEQNLIGLSSVLEYGKENLDGWRWFAGLSHNRLSTRYQNFDKVTTTNTEIGEVSKTIDEQGNESVNLGNVDITTIIENKIIWHRAHDYINLNIGAGKRFMLSNRLSLITDINASYNIWSHHQGYYFDQSSPTIIKFVASEENPYQNQGFGLRGRFTMEYDLGSFSVGLSSLYETAINNTTSTDYFNIKNSHYGVQLGIVYRP